MEVAAEAFDELAARNQRRSIRGNCRLLLLASLVAVITVFVIVLAVDATRTSAARRYAAAVGWEQKEGDHCDAALGRRRLWYGKVVTGSELCVVHDQNRSLVRTFNDASLTFMVIGDWGRDGMCCQRDVAAEMSIVASKQKVDFVLSVGDNFYEKGISAPTDEQVLRSWRDVYISPYPSMQEVQWKAILGNHDHETNSSAQVLLTRRDNLWHMPERYFFETSSDGKVFMAFLDTTVIYYTADELQTYFSGGAVTARYREKQIDELKKAVGESDAEWKFVFGHHPLFASSEHGVGDVMQMKQMRTILMPILRENGVAAYFSGHEHTLEHHLSEGVHFFVSGGGSKVRPLELNLKEARFALGRQGFMTVTVRTSVQEVNVQIVDMKGQVVHIAKVKKG